MESRKSPDTLRGRKAPIDMSADEFRALGHHMVDAIAAFLDRLPEGPVNRDVTPTQVRSLLPAGGMPGSGTPAQQLIDEALPLLFENSLFNGHPRFFGYVTSSPAPIGALADMLAAIVNSNLGVWQLSPVATEIEGQCVRWLAELLGLAPGTGGLLVSGGNMANFIGFVAARRRKAGASLRQRGLASRDQRLLVYASEETHTWLEKAADLFGHGNDSVRWIPVDREQRIDLHRLRAQLQEDAGQGHQPFLLVGNAGTVSTGAVDPLEDLAAVAREHDLWFHVDGAYGAFAFAAPDAPAQLAGMHQADSVAVDPHKWLYVPMEAGCALVRDPDALRDAFSYMPPYYPLSGEQDEPCTHYYQLGFQNSRGFRALKVWMGLRQVGRAGYARMIAEDMRLARALHAEVAGAAELQALTCSLSITTFRYVPADLQPGDDTVDAYLDTLNEELLRRLKQSGELYLTNAIVHGAFALRACIVNFRTALDDILAVPTIVVQHGRTTDADLRPPALRPARPGQE